MISIMILAQYITCLRGCKAIHGGWLATPLDPGPIYIPRRCALLIQYNSTPYQLPNFNTGSDLWIQNQIH